MKVSGFTFCRNVVKYEYPVLEAIQSILPIVDEFVVNVVESEDATEEVIRSIPGGKIRIIKSVWDEALKKDGLVYSEQTNIALQHCTGDWAFYIQADEVIHERDFPGLLRKMEEALPKRDILGLSFRYLHFYGDYFTVNPWAYRRAVRIIRNSGDVRSCGDAVGFSIRNTEEFLHPKGPFCEPSGAWMYHYGYVKNSRVMLEKIRDQATRYHGDSVLQEQKEKFSGERFDFALYSVLKEFGGPHPGVMGPRVGRAERLRPRRNRWLNRRFYQEVFTHGFKG